MFWRDSHFHLLATGALFTGLLLNGAHAKDEAANTESSGFARQGTLGQMIPVSTAIRTFQQRLEKHPDDMRSAIVLGQLYVGMARETGNHSAYAVAEKTLRQALIHSPDSAAAKTQLAAVLEAQHQFMEALSLAEVVYALSPRNTTALATLFECQVTMGRYGDAETSLQSLEKAAGDIPAIQARKAQFLELQGYPADAIQLLETALKTEYEYGTSSVAWFELRLASLHDGQGHAEAAMQHYQNALKADPSLSAAKIGLARLRAATGELKSAESLCREVIESRPTADAFVGLADVQQLTGDSTAAMKSLTAAQDALQREEAAASGAHLRQISRFHADYQRDVAKALKFAQQDLNIRQDIYAYDTLAWALLQNHQPQDAADAIAKALVLNTQDAVLHYHAGMIYAACGRKQEAIAELKTALKINEHFDIRHAEFAREKLSELQSLSKR